MQLPDIYDSLWKWCEAENFSGWDPFDGLNSKIFQASPLKHFAVMRLAWLQTVKRSKKNLRPLLKIEKGVNSKGIALFALAELSRFRASKNQKHAENCLNLLQKLEQLKIEIAADKTAFGYNFDWQSRAFFAPRGTPTIVPTAFVCQAFIKAFEVFGDENFLKIPKKICKFILADLNRFSENRDEVCFSYTPIDKSIIFNASLLAGECLANVGKLTADEEYLETAAQTAKFVVRRQRKDGAWQYGTKLRHAWVDNFHTAYILLSLYRLQKIIPELQNETQKAIEKGLNYWLENFFLSDGTAKYYDKKTFPVDIHSASAAIVALCELKNEDPRCLPLAKKVADRISGEMRDEKGFFYYQKLPAATVKTPFIRWAQAWTAFALARLIETEKY